MSECDDHPCDRIDCYNGGTCTDVDGQGTYGCVCAHGFKGDNCKIVILNTCSTGDDMCHESSHCVFNYRTETYECFCPLTPVPLEGEFCDNSEIQLSLKVYTHQSMSSSVYSHNIHGGQVSGQQLCYIFVSCQS